MTSPDIQEWIRSLRREDNCLAGTLAMPFGGRSFELEVAVETEDEVTADQEATLRGYFERAHAVHTQTLERIFPEYQKSVERYRAFYRDLGEDADVNAPLITSAGQLAPLLKPMSMFLPANYQAGTFGLGFWSRWEQEHGIGVQFVCWHLTETGESAIHFDFD